MDHPPCSSAPLPALAARRTWRRGAGALVACTVAASAGVWAEPAGDTAERIAEAIAGSPQRADGWSLTPELAAVRTRLTPPGAVVTAPDGRPMVELAGVNYRLWLSRGGAGVGLGLGTLGYVRPAPDGRAEGTISLVGAAPTVSLGMRYRVSMRSAVYADASGVLGLQPDPHAGYVNTKVGLEWQPARSRFGFDHGRIGVHFDSGYRLSFRVKRNELGVYLRGQF